MNNDLLPVISELNKVKNIREKMTEFVSLSIQCSDPVDYVSSERVFPMDIITGANYFMFSNPDIPRLLMSNIFTVEESKLTHIFNEKDCIKGRYTSQYLIYTIELWLWHHGHPIKDINI